MNAYDISLTLLILLVFGILFLAPILSVGIQNIQNNWVKYRCNPVVMPFAGLFGEDPTTTFTFCIQSMVKEFMGFLLIPLQESIKVIQNIGGGFETAINDVRKVISAIRSFVTEIIQAVFGVLLNILVEFQKIIVNLKDLMAKLVGIMTTLLFMVYGSMQAMQSAWNGPPGQLARALCFETTTKIRLNNGELREIQNLKLGDKLKDGGVVEGLLTLKNVSNDPFYKFSLSGEEKEDILVTGSHMIKLHDDKWVPVSEHPDAERTTLINPTVYSLITSNQRINIGKYTFWDWNDDEIVKHENIAKEFYRI